MKEETGRKKESIKVREVYIYSHHEQPRARLSDTFLENLVQ